jgi:hypothetical protein
MRFVHVEAGTFISVLCCVFLGPMLSFGKGKFHGNLSFYSHFKLNCKDVDVRVVVF